MNPLNKTDAYKLFHRPMYPKGTSKVVSNLTPRSNRHYPGENLDGMVVAGIQRMLIRMKEDFDKHFFKVDKKKAVARYSHIIRKFTGDSTYSVEHIEKLHDIGYLPLHIRALPEGTLCPIGVPMFMVYNTLPECFWLVNYMETYFSAELWGPCTTATIAREYRQVLEHYAKLSGTPLDFVPWQAHDFSMRGMYGCEAAAMSGIGHLFFFTGTDTIPAYIEAAEYYFGNYTCDIVAGSVPASEHSVQCAHYDPEKWNGDELDYLDHVLDMFPTGIVSIVCDGYDFWKFLTKAVPQRKDRIMSRDGRVVFRPDSGNPADIICGNVDNKGFYINPEHSKEKFSKAEQKGAMEVLWDIFGGTTVIGSNGKEYKHLDTHVGLIYGDSITLARCKDICKRLINKGFSTNNLVLGIGSFTYQHVTRDTMGTAMKATYIEIDGKGKEIFKDPKTVVGSPKKSARGLITAIPDENGKLTLIDQVDWDAVNSSNNQLKTVFKDGEITFTNLQKIRETAESSL